MKKIITFLVVLPAFLGMFLNTENLSAQGSITVLTNPDAGVGINLYPIVYNNNLYYRYIDASGKWRLSKYDGTSITMATNPDAGSGYYAAPTIYNNNLYFQYYNSSYKYQLAKYDGSSLSLIANPDAGAGAQSTSIVYNNYLYLFLYYNNASPHKFQLAKYDGTSLSLIANPDAGDGNNGYPIIYNNNLYFQYKNAAAIYQLAKYDGTSITLVTNPDAGSGFFSYTPVVFNNSMYFIYCNASNKYQLAKYDGTSITLIANPDANQGASGSPVVYNNNLYFKYCNASNIYQLAKYNGTSVSLLTNPDGGNGIQNNSIVYNNYLCLQYRNASSKYQLLKFDGTSFTLIANPDAGTGFTGYPVLYNYSLFFQYADASGVNQLARYNGISVALATNTGGGGFYNNPIVYNNALYFTYRKTTGYCFLGMYGESLPPVHNVTQSTYFYAIQPAIDASVNGDVIEVDAGTYTIAAGAQLNINKQITLRAKAGLSSKPIITTSYSSWTSCAVQIAANNVMIDGFEITSSSAINTNPNYLVGDYYSTSNNWTIQNCNIHQCYVGVFANGNNVTIQGNEIHETWNDCIDCEYGLCDGLKVSHNWLHSEHTNSGTKPAGITFNCDATATSPVEISYNYCNSCRTFIDFQHNGGIAPGNQIVVMHNTVDWNLTALPAVPIPSGTIAEQMSIAFYTGNSPASWNASKIDIRDNIFSRQKWYAIVNTSSPDGLFNASLNLRNNLFYQWYMVDVYYPGNAYTYEWPAQRGAVGWWYATDVPPSFNGDLQAEPLYKATGTTPDSYYALNLCSPALNAATDGTNIGANTANPGQPPLAAGVSIAANNNNVCSGTSITFTATPTNGGSSPTYQWKKNSVNIGTNSSTYSYAPASNDTISCVMTSSICTSGNPATSNKVIMIVNPSQPVSVSIVASANPFCSGSSVTFTATPTNGGTPAYQWKVGGSNIGTNSSTYSYSPANGDIVTCSLTSNANCATGSPATSNSITMTAIAHQTKHYVTTSGVDIICNGTLLNPWLTIQYAINNSLAGDTIVVDAGTYNVGTSQILINKTLVLQAKAGLSSKPKITIAYQSYGNCAVSIAANNVVVDGFEIDGSSAFTTFPTNPIGASSVGTAAIYLIGDYGAGMNNWTVKNCYIHHGREGIRMSGNNNVTIQDNEIAYTIKDCIDARNGNCYGLTVTHNWLHSELPDPQGGKPAGIGYNCDHTAGSDVLISYNYCSACRTFIDFQQSNNGMAPANNISVLHNTVDWDLKPLPATVKDTSKGQHWAIAWWASPTSNNFDASKFIINDNIFSRTKFYAFSSSTGTIIGQIQLHNNIFSQNYLCDAFYPGPDPSYPAYVELTNEWPSTRGVVGWGNYGTGNGFAFIHDTVANPLYVATGTKASDYYQLGMCSPALNAATDGTNIGASNNNPGSPLPLSVSIVADNNSVISGTTVNYTATPVNAVSTSYQWRVNHTNVGTNSSTYSYTPVNNDTVCCILTSGLSCQHPDTSNKVIMIVAVHRTKSWVATSGTDIPANGTFSNPWATVPYAINNCSAGDTIIIESGTYLHTATISLNKSLFIEGDYSGTQPTIQFTDAEYHGITITASNVHLENLRFYRNGNTVGANSALVGIPNGGTWPTYVVAYSNILVKKCTFDWGKYGMMVNAENLTVDSCSFLNQYRNGIILYGFKGTTNITHNYIDGTLRNARNLVYITTGSGTPDFEGTLNINYNTSYKKIQFFIMDFWGVDMSKKVDLNIKHNSIDFATSKPVTFYCPPVNGFTKFNSITIQDNIITNSTLGVVVDFNSTDNGCVPTTGQIAINNNLFFNNADNTNYTKHPSNPNIGWLTNGPTPAGASAGMFSLSGNLAGDPLYNSATHVSQNFDINCGSPAINAATDATNIGAKNGYIGQIAPVSITITSDTNNLCGARTVHYTAHPVNGGSAPVYQWKVNGVNAGTNNIAYSYTPANHDTVACVLTSNVSCPTGNPATSNKIIMIVSSVPTITFTTQPDDVSCTSKNLTYTSQSGMTNYVWTIPGILNTDYTITSGGTSTSNSVTLKYLTEGSKTVKVNYNGPSGCPSDSAISSIATQVSQDVWIGGSSTNWTDGANWCSGVPHASTDAVIPQGSTTHITTSLGTVAVCGNLTVDSGSVLIVDAGSALTVSGTTILSPSARIILKSDPNDPTIPTGSFIDNGFNGNVTGEVEKTLFTGRWWYIGAPVKPVTGYTAFGQLSQVPSTGTRLEYWNETTHAYVIIGNNDTLKPTHGYAFRNYGTTPINANYQGYFNSGTISTQVLTFTSGNYQGYNLVSNPYPSAVNWGSQNSPSTGITLTNIEPTIHYRTNGTFATWNIMGAGTGINGGQQNIPSTQGFWVRVTPGHTTGIIQYTNSARVHNTTALYKQTDPPNVFRMQIARNTLVDETAVTFYAGALTSYEVYDAQKMLSDDATYPQLYSYTTDNVQAAINGQPLLVTGVERIIPLGYTTYYSGTFTLTATNLTQFDAGTTVYLEDVTLHVTQNLSSNKTYTFSSGTGTYTSRFKLHFTKTSNPLPVQLLGFDAKCLNNNVDLNWSTATETNCDYFTVERSPDAANWEMVKQISGGGNSNSVLNYSAKDINPLGGISYYHLKQTDYNGQSEIFGPVSVNCSDESAVINIDYYPNPFSSEVIAELNNPLSENATVNVYDMFGRKVFTKDISQDELQLKAFTLNLADLTSGVYFIEFKSDSYSGITKIVKN